MKILQLIFNLRSGGAERFVVDLTNELSKENQVTLLTVYDNKNESQNFFKDELSNRIKHINLNNRLGLNIKCFFSIIHLIKNVRPDVVHVHLNTILYVLVPSLIFRHKIKFFHTIHNQTEKDIGFKMQRNINRFFYRNNWIIPITISEKIKQTFYNYYGFDNSILIENGCQPLKHTVNFISVKREIESYKNYENSVVFIHVSRFGKAKNQKLLLEVFEKLIQESFPIILLIIGAGFDSPEAIELKEGNKIGIYFLGTRKNIGDYLMNSDVFCLTSIWEGLPISLIEALSCGTTPICTPAGGIPDVITDSKTGYLSENFTYKSYYNTILRYLENKDRIKRNTLVDYFKNNYSIEICAQKYLDAYKK